MMKAFKDIFEGLNSAYGQYVPSNIYSTNGKQKGKPFTVKKQVTDALWQNHLDGKEPALGIIPINENNLCRWGCIDIDQYDFNHKKFIKKIKQKIYLLLFADLNLEEHMSFYLYRNLFLQQP